MPFLLVLGLAVVLRVLKPSWLEMLRPQDVGDALGLTWQVQATIAALAFAALSVIIQLAANSPVAVRSSREVLYRETRFGQVTLFAACSTVTLGVVGIWLPSDGGVVLCFVVCFLGTLAMIGLAYVRATRFFLDDRRASDMSVQTLLAKLDDEVNAQRVAAAVNERLRSFFPQDSPIRRSRGAPAARNVVALAVVTETQRIRDFDALALRIVGLDLLRAVSSEQIAVVTKPGTPPQVATAEPAILLIRYGVNDVVGPGEALFQLVIDNEPAAGVLRDFDQRLRRCVRLGTDTTVDDELATLKDSLLVAAHAGTSGALQRGLRVYVDLFTRILLSGGGRPDAFLFGTYGPYWRAMHRSLREVAAVAIDKLGDVGVVLVTDNAYVLCSMAVDNHEIDALQEFLGLYNGYLRHVAAAPGRLSPEYLLASLQNLLDLRVPSTTGADPDLRGPIETVAASVIADTLKVGVDRGDAGFVERVLAYFRYPALSRRMSPSERAARTAAALAALAWAFHRWDPDRQPDEKKAVCRELLKAFTVQDLWAAYGWAVRSSETGVGWDRWETEIRLPLRFHFMEFHSFLNAAAVVAGSRAGIALPANEPTPADAERAGALLDAFDRAEERARQLDLPPDAQGRDRLKTALIALVDRRKKMDQAVLRTAPLENARIERFASGFSEAIRSTTDRLSDVLLAAPSELAPAEGTKLVVNQLVPREFFVTDPRVSADPAELGRTLAAGLVDGENAYLVNTLAAGQERVAADLEEIRRLGVENDAYLVVVNDWRLAHQLGLDSGTSDDRRPRGLSLSVEGIDEICLVCNLADVARVRRTHMWDDLMGPPPSIELPDIAAAVRDYDQPAEQPVAHLIIGTKLDWTSPPGRGIAVLKYGPGPR